MTEPINRLLLATVLSVSVPQPVYAEVNLDGDVGCQILIPSLSEGAGGGGDRAPIARFTQDRSRDKSVGLHYPSLS